MLQSSVKSSVRSVLILATTIVCLAGWARHGHADDAFMRLNQPVYLPGELAEISLNDATPGDFLFLFVSAVPGALENGVAIFIGTVPPSGSILLAINPDCGFPDVFLRSGLLSQEGFLLTNEVSFFVASDVSCGPSGEGCNPEEWVNSMEEWPVPYSPGQLYADASFVDLFPGKTMLEVLSTTETDDLSTFGAESVAAILNAASTSTDYELILQEIRLLIRDVFTTDRDAAIIRDEVFGFFNGMGCPQ